MAVMQIGVMRVLVPYRHVLMPVRMRFCDWSVVEVSVVFVVHVPMLMRERVVKMFVLMSFGEMQPEPQSHQQCRESQLERHRLAQA